MKIKIFYSQNQQVDDNDSFSPSAGKPAKVAEQYQKHFGSLVSIVSDFKPLSPSQISLAHSTNYVRGVLTGKRSNGFGNTKKSVAKSLPWTTGSLYNASEEALRTRTITCSLTSGFHHAGYNNGGGFCTFNGLVIAAQILNLKFGAKVGIFDADQHYGDGTDNIINKLGLDHITHYTLGDLRVSPQNADAWLDDLEEILLEKFANVNVLVYQAGADPWVNDPLGGRLTKEQLRRRDEITFRVAKKLKIGVAFNLAGGYAKNFQQVLDIHNNTMNEALKASGEKPDYSPATNDTVASNGERNEVQKILWSNIEDDFDDEEINDDNLSEYIAKTLGEDYL